MKTLFRKAVLDAEGYAPGEQPQQGGFVKRNTNENPSSPSPKVALAIGRELAEGGGNLRLYPDPAGRRLREEAARVYGFSPEEVLAGNGSDELLAILVRAVVPEGGRIVTPAPTYVLYRTLAAVQGAELVEVPFPRDFSLPEDLFEKEGRLLFLANPNSPSGNVHPEAEARRLSRAFPGLVVIDEAYVDFAETSLIHLAHEEPNVVVLRTFSKSFSLAGLRCGLAFASREIVSQLWKVRDSYNLDRLALAGAAAALEDLEWMEENRRKIVRTRETLTRGLENFGFEVLPSQANFVFARTDRDAGEIHRGLKERKVLVRYFDDEGLRDGLRITVGTDREVGRLLEELEAIL